MGMGIAITLCRSTHYSSILLHACRPVCQRGDSPPPTRWEHADDVGLGALEIVVLNAELSAERSDGNVRNNFAHRINSHARGRIPCLATQQWVGILSKRRRGTHPSDRGRAPVGGPYLTGVRASQRSAGHSFAKGHGRITLNTEFLQKKRNKA